LTDFLVDSSIHITVLRRNPPPQLVTRLRELLRQNEAAINEIIRLEVLAGCRTQDQFELISTQLLGFPAMAIDDRVWKAAATLDFDLRRAGLVIGLPDLIIASTATTYGATLIHADSDFERIAQHSALKTESYAEAGNA
jgi:predicted nucleic acid-binding protein